MKMLSVGTTAQRQSGIELLKVVAIFMIILAHAVQSLESARIGFLDLSVSTHDPQYLCLFFLRGLGQLGNLMFLIPSIWFLSNGKSLRLNKISEIVLDVFFVSVIGLVTYIIGGGTPTEKEIIQSFYPTISANSWYVTCYLLLYAIFPFLNLVIEHIDRKTHLAYSMAFFVLYHIIGFVKQTLFFSKLIGFVGIYFIVVYCKKYMPKICSSPKKNLLFLCISAAGWIAFALTVNFLGNRSDILHDKMLHWQTFMNPFFLVFAFSLFNLFRVSHIQSKKINRLSSLSLLIYIIHQNYFFISRIRPLYYDFIYTEFSYEYLIGWVLLYAVLLFCGSVLLAALYQVILQPIAHKVAGIVLALLLKIYRKFEVAALKIQ